MLGLLRPSGAARTNSRKAGDWLPIIKARDALLSKPLDSMLKNGDKLFERRRRMQQGMPAYRMTAA